MAVPTCYANPSPTYQRAMRLISGISSAENAVVTTTFAHDYQTGDIVRLYIPNAYGMTALDKRVVTITVTSDTQFSINVDSRSFNSFTTPADPSPHVPACAHVVPVGEVNSKLTSATQNVL